MSEQKACDVTLTADEAASIAGGVSDAIVSEVRKIEFIQLLRRAGVQVPIPYSPGYLKLLDAFNGYGIA